ncbi:waprin-Phi1-like [Carettochelys insculpta]|uniref:waprin-Phi1-like n=1 Tax=Carettochelys insculpta TaxID=44489 RepID=UPI003EC0D327
MVKSSRALLLLGLLAFWAQLPSASGQNVTKKEGVCPSLVLTMANCTEECQDDGDCEENLKCCPTGCGRSCQIPDEKPGQCPEVSGGIPMLGLCKDLCSSDTQCQGSLKCCRNGCRKLVCTEPV